LVGSGLILGLPLWRSLIVNRRASMTATIPRMQLSSVVLVSLLVIALVMLGIFALTPPLLFDVTEYHLGAWTDYLKKGESARFAAMPYNFYARFPFPIESLYFLGLSLS